MSGEIAEAIWALSDGRAGLRNQVLGLAEAVAARLKLPVEDKTVRLGAPAKWLPARALALPALQLPFAAMEGGLLPLKSPWPRLLIACGRQSLPFSLAIKALSGGRTFTVQTQDPRLPARLFDLVVPPAHDGMRGRNVLAIIGSPNRVTPGILLAAAETFAPRLLSLPRPRVAVLIGGSSRAYRLGTEEAKGLGARLAALAGDTGAGLMVTVSRRTGEGNTRILQDLLGPLVAAGQAVVSVPGGADNPYFGFLALADFVLVTADSINMATEAAATGKPLYVLPLPGGSAKFDRFHTDLRARGIARAFEGRLEAFSYAPLRETERAAEAIVQQVRLRGAA